MFQLYCFCLLAIAQIGYSLQIPKTYQFSNDQMFYDLSLYNFYQGKLNTYEFQLNARPHNKVKLYFYQPLLQKVLVNVFDGPTDKSNPIDISNNIPTGTDDMTVPVPVVSSGGNMFVRIMINPAYLTSQLDFQAIATDFVQPEGCGSMVYSLNTPNTPTIPSLNLSASTTQQCIYILHANDPLNNPSLLQSVTVAKHNQYVDLYKGLTTKNGASLAGIDTGVVWAYDKHITVIPKKNADLIFMMGYQTVNYRIDVSKGQTGTLITEDYLQDAYPNTNVAVDQQIIITKVSPVNAVGINYGQLLGNGKIDVISCYQGSQNITQTYSAGHLPSIIVYSADQVVIQYSSPNRAASGFYANYFDATDYSTMQTTKAVTKIPMHTTTKSSTLQNYSLLGFIFIFLTMFMN